MVQVFQVALPFYAAKKYPFLQFNALYKSGNRVRILVNCGIPITLILFYSRIYFDVIINQSFFFPCVAFESKHLILWHQWNCDYFNYMNYKIISFAISKERYLTIWVRKILYLTFWLISVDVELHPHGIGPIF